MKRLLILAFLFSPIANAATLKDCAHLHNLGTQALALSKYYESLEYDQPTKVWKQRVVDLDKIFDQLKCASVQPKGVEGEVESMRMMKKSKKRREFWEEGTILWGDALAALDKYEKQTAAGGQTIAEFGTDIDKIIADDGKRFK
jgi:hypothetical protein